jgi:hypothetical protein
MDYQQSLTPVFDTCPKGWVNPCLEICTRDIRTCCYFRPRGPQRIALKYRRELFRCDRCGDTNERNFEASLVLCVKCQSEVRKGRR